MVGGITNIYDKSDGFTNFCDNYWGLLAKMDNRFYEGRKPPSPKSPKKGALCTGK